MAGKGRGGKRRQTYQFVGPTKRAQIKKYSEFVPSLMKLRGKRRITSQEASQLTKAAKELRYTENLHAVTPKQARVLRRKGLLAEVHHKSKKTGKTISREVQAIRLRNTSPDAKITVTKQGMVVASNGRRWEYHPVPADPDTLITEGENLLDDPRVAQINLWTSRGRVSEGFRSKSAWANYIRDRFALYVQANEFTEGIAALIREKRGNAT